MSEDRWRLLVAHLRRARSKPTFDQEERAYRLEAAAELREIVELANDGGVWQERLRTALTGHFAGRKYDLTGRSQLRWVEALPPEAFGPFLERDVDPVERFDRFLRRAGERQPQLLSPPETWTNPDIRRDAALAFGSLLNFAVAQEEVPVVRPDVFNLLQWTLGYEWTFRIPLAEQYRRHLAFAKDVEKRLRREGIEVRDMLDAGSLIQIAGIEADHWADTSVRMPERRYLSICAIYRNEAAYLAEWIEFHRLVGVEHFFLYDNASEDEHLDVLAPHLDEGVVTLHSWPVIDGQLPAYEDCLRWHRHDSRWIAFIDLDEFLFSPTGRPLPELLPDYEAWPALAVAWVMFGHAGHRTRPSGLVIENYQGRIAGDHLTTNVKCVVDPTRASRFRSSHHLEYPYLTAVDENRFPVHGARAVPASASILRLNHYFFKSQEEHLAKSERWVAVGKPFRRIPTDEDFESVRRQEADGVKDDAALVYLEDLKRALARREQPRTAPI